MAAAKSQWRAAGSLPWGRRWGRRDRPGRRRGRGSGSAGTSTRTGRTPAGPPRRPCWCGPCGTAATPYSYDLLKHNHVHIRLTSSNTLQRPDPPRILKHPKTHNHFAISLTPRNTTTSTKGACSSLHCNTCSTGLLILCFIYVVQYSLSFFIPPPPPRRSFSDPPVLVHRTLSPSLPPFCLSPSCLF